MTGAQAFELATQALLLLVTGFTIFAMGLTTYHATRLAWRLIKQRRDRGRSGPP